MEDFKPNSNKFKAEQANASAERKSLEKVITGTAKTKKKNELRKFTDVFISEDIHNVKSYILMDVLVPAIKKAVSDIIVNGIDMLLYGGKGRDSRRSNASYVSYNKYSERRDDDRRYGDSTRTLTGYSYDDIILPTMGEAQEVLARMDELIDTYGMVKVADLYDLVGLTGNYTDNKYGWTNIRNAEPVRVRDGYMLKLPKALPIN